MMEQVLVWGLIMAHVEIAILAIALMILSKRL